MSEKQVPKCYSVKDTSKDPPVVVWEGSSLTEADAIEAAAYDANLPAENLKAESLVENSKLALRRRRG